MQGLISQLLVWPETSLGQMPCQQLLIPSSDENAEFDQPTAFLARDATWPGALTAAAYTKLYKWRWK